MSLDETTHGIIVAAIELHREMSAIRKPVCTRCCGQSWSRPLTKPCKCGESFAPDKIKRETYGGFSPIALASMNDEHRVVTR